jgi:hypothetical protein
VKIFNIGNYRRAMLGNFHDATWFDQSNTEAVAARKRCTDAALDDLVSWLKLANDGRVAILDGTHSTLAKREYAFTRLEALECKVIFLESVCTSPETVERNIRMCKLGTPDYVTMEQQEAIADFRARVAQSLPRSPRLAPFFFLSGDPSREKGTRRRTRRSTTRRSRARRATGRGSRSSTASGS